MAWVDSMRLRRKADIVRALGWLNLFVSVIFTFLHARQDNAKGRTAIEFGMILECPAKGIRAVRARSVIVPSRPILSAAF